MTRKSFLCLFLLLGAGIGLLSADGSPAASSAPTRGNYVALLKLDADIDPVTASYVQRGLSRASRDGAQLVVIELDTPGGLLESMKQIVEAMLASPVPVAVWVAPAGARAASAGVFVAMAAQIVAMAPGTNIGAAHPVTGSGGELGGTEGEKVLNDAVAKIRALATMRGRNADWAEQAVRKSLSLTVDEAVDQRVADFEAADEAALLRALDGREVSTPAGEVVLRTSGLPTRSYELGVAQRVLVFLVDPNIAYVLFLLGIIGMVFEFKSPGIGLPGVLGGISLLVALVAFGSLSVNVGGVLLIVLAVVLFLIDIKAPTHGILTAGGIIALLVGSFLLFPPWRPVVLPGWPGGRVSPFTISGGTILLTLFFLTVVTLGVRAQKRRLSAGREVLIGREGVALSALSPSGIVRVGSEEWSAAALGDEVSAGDEIQVVGVEGVHLVVIKK